MRGGPGIMRGRTAGWKQVSVIAVMYSAEGGTFDHAYYMQTHMPLVHRLWEPMGLQGTQVLRGVPGPDGTPAANVVTTLLTFSSMDAFKAAAAAHGKEIFADIPNFTPIKPTMHFSEPVS